MDNQDEMVEDDSQPVDFFQQQDFLALFADNDKTFEELLAAVQAASDDIKPDLYKRLKDINRQRLCTFLDEMKANDAVVKDIISAKEENGPPEKNLESLHNSSVP